MLNFPKGKMGSRPHFTTTSSLQQMLSDQRKSERVVWSGFNHHTGSSSVLETAITSLAVGRDEVQTGWVGGWNKEERNGETLKVQGLQPTHLLRPIT